MKIVHLCLGAFFPDGYSYQENMLPKFHKKAGYDVEVIASLQTFDQSGKTAYYPEAKQYVNENNVLVTRLEYRYPVKLNRKLRRFVGLSDALEHAVPDILFIHNIQFIDIRTVKKYLCNHTNVKVFCDNHADFSNSATNWISRKLVHGIIWKHCAKLIEPYTEKFYGVLPARVDFLKDVYGLPKEKCELLVMGADDDVVEESLCPDVRSHKRSEYGLKDKDIVIMTGGKIDFNKSQTLKLMEAVNSYCRSDVVLLIFGSVIPELQEKFKEKLSDRVRYIGWKNSEKIYEEFAAADIICFPGLHSVLWEQAVAMGKPCIFKKINGFTHIDIGGNCVFFECDSVEEYIKKITYTVDNLKSISDAARQKGKDTFSYRVIAEKAINHLA